ILRMKIIKKYGEKCANPNCPIPSEKMDIRCLHIDHVHNDGYKERKEMKAHNSAYMRKVLADTEGNYQLLCPYCNWLKRCNISNPSIEQLEDYYVNSLEGDLDE